MNAVLVPSQPKIYHIVHVDRLPSIVADGLLWCDAEIVRDQKIETWLGCHRRAFEFFGGVPARVVMGRVNGARDGRANGASRFVASRLGLSLVV